MLASNPAAGMKLPRKGRKRPLYLTHEQVAALAEAAGEHEGLVLTLAYTGIRWGEMAALRVRDLDMLRRRITVHENAVEVGSRVHVGTTKGHKLRTVPVPAFLLPIWHGNARARAATIWCSPERTGTTSPARIPNRDGWTRQ